MMDRRLIEVSFPVKEVSEEATRERYKSSELSALHLWWARRPLASSRATNYASLIPAPKDEIDLIKKRNFIIELAKSENAKDSQFIKKARKEILEIYGNKSPKTIDPFSGGGSIPFEALRIGCDSYASDYNPVSILIEKCALSYPQLYGENLTKDVYKWGNWVLNETKKEIGKFYPKDESKEGFFKGKSTNEIEQISYIWSWTVKCQNPLCDADIPLLRQYLLAKKKK